MAFSTFENVFSSRTAYALLVSSTFEGSKSLWFTGTHTCIGKSSKKGIPRNKKILFSLLFEKFVKSNGFSAKQNVYFSVSFIPSFFFLYFSFFSLLAFSFNLTTTLFLQEHEFKCSGLVERAGSECSAEPQCPHPCKCANGIVDCRENSLTKVPTHLPEDTTELFVKSSTF